jgi:hypothetical protein
MLNQVKFSDCKQYQKAQWILSALQIRGTVYAACRHTNFPQNISATEYFSAAMENSMSLIYLYY